MNSELDFSISDFMAEEGISDHFFSSDVSMLWLSFPSAPERIWLERLFLASSEHDQWVFIILYR